MSIASNIYIFILKIQNTEFHKVFNTNIFDKMCGFLLNKTVKPEGITKKIILLEL